MKEIFKINFRSVLSLVLVAAMVLMFAGCGQKQVEENPEASLTELAEMMEPPITKPAMNHRLKKLVQMSKE